MSSIYPTRQPITKANIEAFLADAIARKQASSIIMRAAGIGKVTPKAVFKTAIVERMADQMLDFGEGMTNADLNRIHGWSYPLIEACAAEANELARQRANMN